MAREFAAAGRGSGGSVHRSVVGPFFTTCRPGDEQRDDKVMAAG